ALPAPGFLGQGEAFQAGATRLDDAGPAALHAFAASSVGQRLQGCRLLQGGVQGGGVAGPSRTPGVKLIDQRLHGIEALLVLPAVVLARRIAAAEYLVAQMAKVSPQRLLFSLGRASQPAPLPLHGL